MQCDAAVSVGLRTSTQPNSRVHTTCNLLYLQCSWWRTSLKLAPDKPLGLDRRPQRQGPVDRQLQRSSCLLWMRRHPFWNVCLTRNLVDMPVKNDYIENTISFRLLRGWILKELHRG